MDAKQAAALREPFPESAIGKLPKSTCRQCSQAQNRRCDRHAWVQACPLCHGNHSSATLHLDYVGHAATTDRLLKVDPEWTWEPFALDESGLPALDRAGNLWIKLTVAGVTRIGVGDGKSAKECIGDAIRNAAMRFGVALDLWAKEDLHSGDTDSAPDTPAIEPLEQKAERLRTTPPDDPWQTPPPEDKPSGDAITEKQLGMLGRLMKQAGMDRDGALAYVADVIGRQVDSRNDLTKREAGRVIDALQKDLEPAKAGV